MNWLLLTRTQFLVFASISAIVTIPFLLLTLAGQIKNESALILALPFLAGMPWGLLYDRLDVDIPGFTSPGVPDQAGDLTVSVFHLLLLMLPVYLNMYLAVRIMSGGRRADARYRR